MIEKVNLKQTLDRLLAFYEGRLGNGIMADISFLSSDSKKPEQTDEDRKARVRECLILEKPRICVDEMKKCAAQLRASWSDEIPVAYPTFNFGESVWSAFFGGEITFSGTNAATWSYCRRPPIKDLEKFKFPQIEPQNPWLLKMLGVTDFFVKNIKPVCDVTPFIFYDCLNLLVELRGASTAYTDLYDYPDIISRFFDWSVDVNMRIFDAQAALLTEFTDASIGEHPFKKYGSSRTPNLSIDAYGMCAPDIYEQYGLEQHRRIVKHYGGARLHIHGNGRRLCELVARIKGLNYCLMGDDVGFPPAWTVVGELKKRMHPVPIGVAIPREEFLKGLKAKNLPGGVIYQLSAESLSEANKTMERVFEYKPLE